MAAKKNHLRRHVFYEHRTLREIFPHARTRIFTGGREEVNVKRLNRSLETIAEAK